MTAQTMYDAFLPADVGSILTLAAANAVANAVDVAIAQLVLANPALQDMFRPWHFSFLQSVYAKAKAAPHAVGSLLATINRVKFKHAAPSLACAEEFAWVIACVMTTLAPNSHVTARAVAPLVAQLMNPQPWEVVLDMVCGHGDLLLACAAQLAQTQPNATLRMHGMEKDADQWSLVKMLFLLAGLPHQNIQHQNALSTSFNALSDAEKILAAGADMVVMVLPEQFAAWRHGLAVDNQDPRFKAQPPIDARLALAWLGLAAMKPGGGRMAIAMPVNALDALGGLELRKHMVDANLLDAVITLPGIKDYILLVLHTQRTQAKIGFIQTQCPINNFTENGIIAVRNAWRDYQTGRDHPSVVRIERTVIAANHYQFALQGYEGQIQASSSAQNMPALLGQPPSV